MAAITPAVIKQSVLENFRHPVYEKRCDATKQPKKIILPAKMAIYGKKFFMESATSGRLPADLTKTAPGLSSGYFKSGPLGVGFF